MDESDGRARCWVVTEGHAGMENQCVGLAERVGLPFVVKRVRPRPPWTLLPPAWWPAPLAALGPGSDALAPPWPELMITCGRRSVAYSLFVRRASAGRSFTVHVQDPKTAPERFDLLAVPRHDMLSGPNVLQTTGALHGVTPERLAAAAARIGPALSDLPRPLLAVLVGGSNGCYRLTPGRTAELADQLAVLAAREGVGLAVTPSRRTGADNVAVLRQRLAGSPALVWDGRGENPYFGYLGAADAVVVTCDSVNMVSEACATGKPVHVVDLPGGNARFRAFHDAMHKAGCTRPFTGRLQHWTYDAPDDTAAVAAEIRRRLAARSGTRAAA